MIQYLPMNYTQEQIKAKVLEFFKIETEQDKLFWQTEDSWYGDDSIDVQFCGKHPEYGNDYQEFEGVFEDSQMIAGVYRLFMQPVPYVEKQSYISTDLSSNFALIGIKLDKNDQPYINAYQFFQNENLHLSHPDDIINNGIQRSIWQS